MDEARRPVTHADTAAGPGRATPPPRVPSQELDRRRGVAHPADSALSRIAFGSCNRTDLPQPLWGPIVAYDPQLWVWLGDNVYGDTVIPARMRAEYQAQLDKAGYRELLETAEIAGTWDDHDYGANNAGREFAARDLMQREALDFLGVPRDSPRRTREGLYGSRSWGPEGRRVTLILLDARYFRDEPGSNGTILGETQWAWLESQLRGSDAQVHLIANGIQILHEEHRFEKWADFPGERERLLQLIAETGVPGAVLLSGDRHISEIAVLPSGPVGYPLYEVTSSGMTHSYEDNPGEPNRYRIGELYTRLGFGTITLDWEEGTMALQLRTPENAVAEEVVVRLDELRARPTPR
jgi:alkaline phosphatase D